MDDVLAATQEDLFWLPDDVRRLDRSDVLALCDGSTKDLHNQVIRVRASDATLPALIGEIDRWHTGVSQWLVVPPNGGSLLQRHLPVFGYAPRFEGDAYTLGTEQRFSEGAVQVVRVHDLQTLHDNIAACSASFERPVGPYDADRELARCTGPSCRTARFVAYVDGSPVGSANLNVHREQDFGFLWAGGVVPSARGRGVYRALLGARIRWASAAGLANVGLYANRHTSGPVVAGLGFTKHGPMAYYWRDAPDRFNS